MLAKICKIFVDTSPAKMEKLNQSIVERNFKQVAKVAHSLKGSVAELGAIELHELFSQLELEAKKQHLEKVEQLHIEIVTHYQLFISIIKKY